MLKIDAQERAFPFRGKPGSCLVHQFLLILTIGLSGCATSSAPDPAPTPTPVAPSLLHDELFAPPSVEIRAEDVFAVSEPMKQHLRTVIASQAKSEGLQGGLVRALYTRGDLKLEYDSSKTRTASEAFEARSGNCLSLVVMTAAFAKELGLQVRYQSAYVEETWTRNGNLLLRAGHVNVTLGPKLQDRSSRLARAITVDFLPSHDALNVRASEIPEQTIIAMYMNNRAVEAVVQGRIDDAYAWTRASLQSTADFLPAYNTLGILYKRRGYNDLAEATFRFVLQQDPKHTRAMANLAEIYAADGREAEAASLRATLARLEPEPPMYLFNLGMLAMQRKDYKAASDLFAREAARNGYSTEVSYWLGVSLYQLGDIEQANRYLNYALETVGSRSDRERYSAKLARLKSGLN